MGSNKTGSFLLCLKTQKVQFKSELADVMTSHKAGFERATLFVEKWPRTEPGPDKLWPLSVDRYFNLMILVRLRRKRSLQWKLFAAQKNVAGRLKNQKEIC